MRFLPVVFAALALTACDRNEADTTGLLERLTANNGPDELAVLPQKPLQQPDSLAYLPAPTPGKGNLADFNPRADFVAALTGSAPRDAATLAGDAALVAAIESRAGVSGAAGQIVYVSGAAALDPFAELERLRALGINVPPAPPG